MRQFLQHLIGGGYRFTVDFVSALHLNHIDQFFRHVDVRRFNIPLIQQSRAVQARRAFVRCTGGLRFGVEVFANTLQSGIIHKGGEIAYLGDRYQISIDRLSDLQDLIDKYNAAKPEDQKAAMRDIVDFIYDDYRQVLLAPHKRMDIIVGSLLMTGAASVKNKDDNAGGIDLLNIDLPFKFIKPDTEDKDYFVTYLQQKLNELKSIYGTFPKMIMSRGTFIKNIIGSSEFGDKFKMQLTGNEMYMSTGLITSQLASTIFTGIGLPAIEIKEDYVVDQTGKNIPIYADGRISLLPQDKIGYMRFHTPYEAVDGVPGRNYTQADGDMLISGYKDGNGRYLEYTAEWIPQIANPNLIVNFDLSEMNA